MARILTIKIIAISGGGKASPRNYINLAMVPGADEVFSKLFSINDLIKKINNLLNSEQPH